MKAAVSLKVLNRQNHRLAIHSGDDPPPRLPRVEQIDRDGPVLHTSPISEKPGVLSLNLARGCFHRCAFCSVRAHPMYRGNEVIQRYTDTLQRLEQELTERSTPPKAVYLSPSTDPFPPLAEFQAETARVVELLARHGVESWLMTRGYIRPSAIEVLAAHREHVKVTIGMTTFDRDLQRRLEPLTAPPRIRLRQIARLQSRGIPVQVALEPLVPGLTDTRENLSELLEQLAKVGVRHVSAGYLFMRQGIRDNLSEVLKPLGIDQEVFQAFNGGPVLQSGQLAPARYLPGNFRKRGYAVLMALAANYGISVSVGDVTNPDFRPPRRMPPLPRPQPELLPIF